MPGKSSRSSWPAFPGGRGHFRSHDSTLEFNSDEGHYWSRAGTPGSLPISPNQSAVIPRPSSRLMGS